MALDIDFVLGFFLTLNLYWYTLIFNMNYPFTNIKLAADAMYPYEPKKGGSMLHPSKAGALSMFLFIPHEMTVFRNKRCKNFLIGLALLFFSDGRFRF